MNFVLHAYTTLDGEPLVKHAYPVAMRTLLGRLLGKPMAATEWPGRSRGVHQRRTSCGPARGR